MQKKVMLLTPGNEYGPIKKRLYFRRSNDK